MRTDNRYYHKRYRIKTIILYPLFLFSLLLFLFSCMEDTTPSIVGYKEDVNDKESIKGGGPDEPNTSFSHIFKRGDEGYHTYRIPALVKTKTGTLLAFAEARKNSASDTGDIDLVVRRSSDDGATWSEITTVWNDGVHTCGNPAPVVDQTTGTIFLLMTWNNGADDIGPINAGTSIDTRRAFVCHSTDDGFTWSTPEEITSTTKKETWGWYATGPCHGIQLTKGEKKGRLMIPCDYISKAGTGGGAGAHVIYSDDQGATWQLGGITTRGNESTVAELSDGRLLLNIRISNNNNFRVVSTSNDAGGSWSPPVNAPLVDPVCQGSMVSGTLSDGSWALFFSNPSSNVRENMMIKLSLDDGVTWSKQYSVYTGKAGYSDLVFLSDQYIGILYECGTSTYNDGIAYRKISTNSF